MATKKLKSSRGAAKRFKKTAGGWRCKQSHLRHILTKKSTKRKRHLRGTTLVDPTDAARIDQLLPHA